VVQSDRKRLGFIADCVGGDFLGQIVVHGAKRKVQAERISMRCRWDQHDQRSPIWKARDQVVGAMECQANPGKE